MKTIDAFILDRFERFSHFMQRSFGVTSLSLFRVSIAMTVACLLFGIDKHPFRWVLVALRGVEIVNSIFDPGFYRPSPGFMNHRKITQRLERIICLFIIPIDCYLLWIEGRVNPWFEWATAELYFKACDDLPPGESRVRQWLRSLRGSLNLTPAPAGARRVWL